MAQHVLLARVQSGRRLVEHIGDAEQARAQLRREPQPLQLAGGEGACRTIQRQVSEPEAHDGAQHRQHGGQEDPLRLVLGGALDLRQRLESCAQAGQEIIRAAAA